MRAARWYSCPPGDQVPDDSGRQGGKDDPRRHDGWIDNAGTQCLRHVQTEEQEGEEVEERGPDDGGTWRQNPGGDDGGDRVGRIMQAVEEIEEKGDGDQAEQ